MHARVDGIGRAWLANGRLSGTDLETLREDLRLLSALYAEHIAFEDEQLFPAASSMLDQSSLVDIGCEMAQRRGLSPGARSGRRD